MVGEKIKEIRLIKNLSLRKLAGLAGISNAALSDIENSKSNPSIATLQKLADALNIKQEEFFMENVYNEKLEEDKKEVLILDLIKTLVKEGIIKDENNISVETLELLIKTIEIMQR